MGTEVLRPQDPFIERLRAPSASRRRRNPPDLRNFTNIIDNRKQNTNTGSKKISPKADKKKSTTAAEKKKSSQGGATGPRRKAGATNNSGLVMGQVTLLRRGESLSSLASETTVRDSNQEPRNLEVYGADRIATQSPQTMPKHVRLAAISLADLYAGGSSSWSPSPRSVPLPSFLNQDRSEYGGKLADDSGGRYLLRSLRL